MKARLFDQDAANDCFGAHQALVQAELANPALRENPQWIMLRQDAYERFAISYEVPE